MPATQPERLLDSLKRVAAMLRDADVEFALGGGLAAWARGGPPTDNDIDLLIRAADCDRAHAAVRRGGLRTEIPPEGWLVKAHDGDVLIDLIHHPRGFVVDDELLGRCDEMIVHAVPMRVMRAGDLMVSKLLALTEHKLDLGPLLEITRALREQIDWDDVWRRTSESPFARTFFCLVRELRLLDGAAAPARLEVV
jgi:predicted nucleotidyltransferase